MARDDSKDRSKLIDQAISQIQKSYGEGSIMKLGEAPSQHVDIIPTGALSLDHALGVGGVPRGRVIEIYGPEASGKTTLALSIIAEAQRMGGVAAFVDAEHAIDVRYAERLGVNIDELLVSQPDTGEQALDITEMLVRSNAVDVIAIDSVAALVPRAEIEGDMGDIHVGLQARLMSQALRKLSGVVSKARTVVVFINQIREKIGVMFGNPETTPGGRALKFYSSVRIDIRRIASLKVKGEMVGNRTRCKVVKNKVSPPFRECEFDIIYGRGISKAGDILDLAAQYGIVNKSGAWYTYGKDRLGQGREAARDFLESDKKTMGEIENKVRQQLEIPSPEQSGGKESGKKKEG